MPFVSLPFTPGQVVKACGGWYWERPTGHIFQSSFSRCSVLKTFCFSPAWNLSVIVGA